MVPWHLKSFGNILHARRLSHASFLQKGLPRHKLAITSIRRYWVVRILVIEDDITLARVVRRGLLKTGHTVDLEHDGREGEYLAAERCYEAIVLDIMLPTKDGVSIARDLRRHGVRTPILILSARDTVEDTIAGLDAGADDYLRKPFVFAELNARLRSLARREPVAAMPELTVGEVTLNLASRTVMRAGHAVDATPRETAFLEYFMRRAGQIVTRAMLEEALWSTAATSSRTSPKST